MRDSRAGFEIGRQEKYLNCGKASSPSECLGSIPVASRFIRAAHFLPLKKKAWPLDTRNWPLTATLVSIAFQAIQPNILPCTSIGLSPLDPASVRINPNKAILRDPPLFFRLDENEEEREGREIEETGKVSNPLGTEISRARTYDGWIWHRIRFVPRMRTRDRGSCAPRRRGQVEETRNGRRIGDDSGEGYIGCIGLEWIPYFPRSANRKMELVRPEDSTKADYWPTLLRLQMFRRDTIRFRFFPLPSFRIITTHL